MAHIPRVGLAVAFAALSDAEREAIDLAWTIAGRLASCWNPSFAACGLDPLGDRDDLDLLVYLGESSRFTRVAGGVTARVPVLFVKSTIEELLDREPDAPPRYRMSTGVTGIASALAAAAALDASVDWTSLAWPTGLRRWCRLDPEEQRYVDCSVDAFRRATEAHGGRWCTGPPDAGAPFSLFLTMHDPGAAILASAAGQLWPQCTVLTGDGMVSGRAADGTAWPEHVIRVRHWSARHRSTSNRIFRTALGNRPLPDFDSAGMLFGALRFLDEAFQAGATPDALERAGERTGPLGPMRMTPGGRPYPERLALSRGSRTWVVTVEEITRAPRARPRRGR